MRTRHPLVLIAAVAENRVIGRAGALPWHLPGDLRHFRDATMGRPLLMGRRTFETLGRALPGRALIVVSGDAGFAPADVIVARSIDKALALADREADRLGADRIMVGGGGTLYRALIGEADRMILTLVEAAPEGDTHFPPFDRDDWLLGDRQDPVRQPADSAAWHVEHWTRHRAMSRTGNDP